jgi:membrane protein
LLAAIGFEVLKLVGTYYVDRITNSPTGAVIGPVVGVLVWIYLVSRYLLFCVAWAATAPDQAAITNEPIIAELTAPVQGPGFPASSGAKPLPPAAVAAGLLSAGAALGAGLLAALQRRMRATGPRRSAR